MKTLRKVLVAGVLALTLIIGFVSPAFAAPTWWETNTQSCNGWQYTNSNRVKGFGNLSSKISNWESTSWNNGTTVRVYRAHKNSGGNYTHKRGINQTGGFDFSGSYSYCR